MHLHIKISSAILLLVLCSCSPIRTVDYFRLNENQVETYDAIFVKYTKDSVFYKKVEQLFGSISDKDTVAERTKIIYRTVNIDGHKAFYAVETVDTAQNNPTIGPRHFLFSSLIFFNDTVFIAPVYYKADLDVLGFDDFKYKIPPLLKRKDTIRITDGNKRILLQNFSKTTLSLYNQRFSDCLTFDVLEIWPETSYTGKVWLHKQYGLLKWLRSTGRIETRVL